MAFVAKTKAYQASFRKKNLETKSEFLKKGTDKGYMVIPGSVMADPALSPYEKLVYGYLLSCIRSQGHGKCNPSDLRIAAYCGISERQVQNARDVLKDQMWLDWERTSRSNEYRLKSHAEHDEMVTQIARVREARSKEKTT